MNVRAAATSPYSLPTPSLLPDLEHTLYCRAIIRCCSGHCQVHVFYSCQRGLAGNLESGRDHCTSEAGISWHFVCHHRKHSEHGRFVWGTIHERARVLGGHVMRRSRRGSRRRNSTSRPRAWSPRRLEVPLRRARRRRAAHRGSGAAVRRGDRCGTGSCACRASGPARCRCQCGHRS